MPGFWRSLARSLIAVSVLSARRASADCECGYAINSTTSPKHEVFTDVIESDFLTIQDVSVDTDWKVQKYFLEATKGPYGRNCTAANVVSNPVADNSSLAGPSKNGGAPGLQLWVRSGDPGPAGLVPSGEIRTVRNDMLYGSFRTSVKLTDVNGTCSAMFTYYNDTQEVDIELLSRQYNNASAHDLPASSPLNLVLHSFESIQKGFQKPNSSTYGMPVIPYDLTDGFHEFRFDWTPGLVSFYFDGKWLWDLQDSNVPQFPSAMLLSHWSNGAKGWSQGPPAQDAAFTVSYFKAYFNSSDAQRAKDFTGRCKDPSAPNAVCVVPDQRGAPAEGGSVPGGSGTKTFFFSEQGNHTVNQTVYSGQKNAASGLRGGAAELWGWALVGAVSLMIPLSPVLGL